MNLFHFTTATLVTGSSSEAIRIQNVLNSQDPSIQFEIELHSEDGLLPFLNIKIKVNDQWTIETGWYTKPANEGLMLNEKSHHPEEVKKTTTSNTIATYEAICSNHTMPKEAEVSFEDRANRNGYKTRYINDLN